MSSPPVHPDLARSVVGALNEALAFLTPSRNAVRVGLRDRAGRPLGVEGVLRNGRPRGYWLPSRPSRADGSGVDRGGRGP